MLSRLGRLKTTSELSFDRNPVNCRSMPSGNILIHCQVGVEPASLGWSEKGRSGKKSLPKQFWYQIIQRHPKNHFEENLL